MRKLTVALLLVSVVGGFVYFGYSFFASLKPIWQSADHFLALVGENKIREAHEELAPAARDRLLVAELEEQMEHAGLTSFASSSWHQVNVMNSRAFLAGTVTLRGGRTVEISMHLVFVDGAWRVSGFADHVEQSAEQ
jgi:hypothetical protein